MNKATTIQRMALAAALTGLLVGLVPMAEADDLSIHQVRGCNGDQNVGTWYIKNSTNHVISRNITQWYENNNVASIDYKYPVTVGAGQDLSLGCTAWYRDNVGHQSFSLGTPAPLPQIPAPAPAAPATPSAPQPVGVQPTGFSDPAFKFLGIVRFYRSSGQGGWTEDMSVPVYLDPGMQTDTGYLQVNERRGPRFDCCGGGASSDLTVDQIPAGFYVEIGGANYYSAYDPVFVSSGWGPFHWGPDQFHMTLYCGPPSDRGCEVNMKVWVVQK